MSYEADLLRALDDEPATRSRVDLWRAITVGRRRRFYRRAARTGAATVAVLAILLRRVLADS
jgi:hypothetical protein